LGTVRSRVTGHGSEGPNVDDRHGLGVDRGDQQRLGSQGGVASLVLTLRALFGLLGGISITSSLARTMRATSAARRRSYSVSAMVYTRNNVP